MTWIEPVGAWCPVMVTDLLRCPTDVQRTCAGSLADGLAAHIGVVHGVPAPRAAELAAQAAADPAFTC